MKYTEEQKKNILMIYPSIEEYERISKLREAQTYLQKTDYIANKIVEYQTLTKEEKNTYKEFISNFFLPFREFIKEYQNDVNNFQED